MSPTKRAERPEWGARSELDVLNTDLRRVDGADKVSGRAKYAHDVRRPDMLHARLVISKLPAGDVTNLDLGAAMAVPGVVEARAVGSGRVMFLGQPVAVVAAETAEAADEGAHALTVEMEESDWVVSEEMAIADDAPSVGRGENARIQTERGDRDETEQALAASESVVEATYELPVQHHCCLETHGMVVEFDGQRARAWASSQDTNGVAREVARVLGIGNDSVEAIVDYMGGGFGSKFSIGVEGQVACELARDLRRPVHLFTTRQQEFLMAGNRSGGRQVVRGGISLSGELVGLQSEIWRHGGIGRGSNPGLPYVYRAAASHMQMGSVNTNNDSNRAMRAPGHPQASFAMESILDELAYSIGMDPFEVRIANLEDPVYHRQLQRVAQEIGWFDHPWRTQPGPNDGGVQTGIGFGVSTWGGGGREVCVTTVRIDPDGSVTSSAGSQDLGTGVRTYVGAIVAEELGLPASAVTGLVGRSAYGPANGSGGSTTTGSLAPSVKHAAHNARVAFSQRLAQWLQCSAEDVVFEDGRVKNGNDPQTSLSWTEACSILGADPIVVTGSWQEHLQTSGIRGAQAARVEVDTATGELRVTKMVCVQDVGLPLNRIAVESQINGGLIEALGYALYEERILDPWLGAALTANFDDYKLPNSAVMPELVPIIDDEDTREQPIGMAEATIIPGASAIANAVHNACGARVRRLPLTPDKILAALGERA